MIYALSVASDCLECLGIYGEVQLSGETDCAHHAQRVIAECDVGVERGAEYAFLHVANTVKHVDEFAESVTVDADSERVYREVASREIFFKSAVLDHRFARVTVV